MKRISWIVMLALLLASFSAQAQDIQPIATPDETANLAITFPPPVWAIADTITITGTADVVGMTQYAIEYRELTFDDPAAVELWFPATLPRNQVVRNGELGQWNTTTVRDGLYALRLVVTKTDGQFELFVVSPIRVANDAAFAPIAQAPVRPTLPPTPTDLFVERPPLQATPTALVDSSSDPLATARVDANVRQGDDTSYELVGFLLRGEQARIIGVSATGSGWYYIELPNGRRGFIAPSVVTVSGNTIGLAGFNPPPPPAPTATNTPVATGNLRVTGLRLDPPQPRCGEGFDIYINVTNTGNSPTTVSGVLTVTDRHVATGSTSGQTTGGFPTLNPGDNFVVVSALTVTTFYEEEHEIIVRLDTRGDITETNENDNVSTLRYTLDQGTCP